MSLAPEEFPLHVDEDVRRLLSPRRKRKDFFEEAKALLGSQFETAMRQAEAFKALVEASGPLQAFLQTASAMSLDIFGPKVRRVYEVDLSFGCPEPLAKALVDLSADRPPDKAADFGELEAEIWAKMVEECAMLAALRKRAEENVHKIEEA